jgi:hypothetical protein
VTRIRIPPDSPDGWASRVETWCLTFSKGKDCASESQRSISGASLLERLTESFSTIPAAPPTEADSKVSMELSRWDIVSTARIPNLYETHVESRQLLPVNIKLVIVELGELLCSAV